MEIVIKGATITSYYEFEKFEVENACKGVFVNVLMGFQNLRTKAITANAVKLDTEPTLQRITLATTGDLFAKGNYIEGQILREGPLRPNLRDQLPIVAERGVPFEGWVQFYLPGINPATMLNKTPTVIIVDSQGEEHRRGTPPLRKSEFEKH